MKACFLITAAALGLTGGAPAAAAGDEVRPATAEPDFRAASGWWADLWNIWTPIGWRDHLHRFNVLWDGSILAKPDLNRRSKGLGLQLALTPDHDEWARRFLADTLKYDDHQVVQGWNRDDAPVLWSQWSKDGCLVRSEVFAHIAGGGDTRTGDEPLYLWVRLRVHDPGKAPSPTEGIDFDVVLQAPHVQPAMTTWDNVRFDREKAPYPKRLTAEPGGGGPDKGLRIVQDDSLVRLAVAPGGDALALGFIPPTSGHPWSRIHVRLPARKHARVDLLAPMLAQPRPVFDAELARGYDAALGETRSYWRTITTSPTEFETPEEDVNEGVRQSVRFSNLLTEKNPATGKYCKVNGSWAYADLWTTPGSMDLVMLMDTLGHHRFVERYLDILMEEQGTVRPPGPAYKIHPGYFSTPALYKSIDWLADNGAVLYTVATHALLTGDPRFIERSTPRIIRSCEWIAEARRLKNHEGYQGVLPPAVATDNRRVIQGIWPIGWNYKGLSTAVRLLRKIKHPRAEEFAREAESYREDFLKALRDKLPQAPTWRDAQGAAHRLVPTTLSGGEEAETEHAFYLDCGPLFLVFAGLLDARDPLMRDARAYFRSGPQHQTYRYDADCWQRPVLRHEMSSCEPCYSWNTFHSWQLGDRERYLEGMYSLFAGALSRQTRISCETRGGITGNVFAASLAVYLARLAVIDDQSHPDELNLLRLMPLAWLRPDVRSAFRHVPTEHGPVTVETKRSADGGTLDVLYQTEYRDPPARVWLHVPPAPGLKSVAVNGKTVWSGGARIVPLHAVLGEKKP